MVLAINGLYDQDFLESVLNINRNMHHPLKSFEGRKKLKMKIPGRQACPFVGDRIRKFYGAKTSGIFGQAAPKIPHRKRDTTTYTPPENAKGGWAAVSWRPAVTR